MASEDLEREAKYLACGMAKRMARKKARIVCAYARAIERTDRRATSKWLHANTRFDTTNVNGHWTMRQANERP